MAPVRALLALAVILLLAQPGAAYRKPPPTCPALAAAAFKPFQVPTKIARSLVGVYAIDVRRPSRGAGSGGGAGGVGRNRVERA